MRLDPHSAGIPAHLLRLMSAEDRTRYSQQQDQRRVAAPAHASLDVPGARASTPVDLAPSVDLFREEVGIQGEILGWLRAEGYEPCYPRPDRKSTLPLGWPDITLASKGGRAVAMEVKTAHGELSHDQTEKIFSMRRAGWLAEVVRSLADAKAFLRRVENGPN